jgi:exopolysaccharide biosynthesis WecB/TagA/CpsF family protein
MEPEIAPPPAIELFGVRLNPVARAEAARLIALRPAALPFGYVVPTNAVHIVLVDREPERLRAIWDGAWLSLLDSSITELLARLVGVRVPLTTGSDLTAHLFNSGAVAPDEPITIIGCTEEAVELLKARYRLTHVLHYNPPMGFIASPQEVACVVDFVAASPARLHFLAVGAPQSEIVATVLARDGRAHGLGLCVGASLNFLAGVDRRAPRWMREHRLEWLFRIAIEPRRIGRRVIVDCLPIFPIVARDMVRRRRARKRPG